MAKKKAATEATATDAVKAVKSLAKYRKKRKASRPNPATANPPAMVDLTHAVLPGFGAYAASRVLQRIAFTVVSKRWPRLAKHAHAATGVASFAGAWLLAHRWSKLAKFHDGILVGSGVAALQGVAQCYLPAKYNWLISDCSAPTGKVAGLPAGMRPVKMERMAKPTAGDEFDYLEEQLEAIERTPARTISPPKAARTPIASAMKHAELNDADDTSTFDADLSDILEGGEGVDDLYSGSFEQN